MFQSFLFFKSETFSIFVNHVPALRYKSRLHRELSTAIRAIGPTIGTKISFQNIICVKYIDNEITRHS